MRYARGIDRMDMDLIRSCYHPDALHDRGAAGSDVEEFMSYLRSERGLPMFDMTSHFIGNQLVEIVGDEAYSESYCIAHHRLAEHPESEEVFILVGLRYIDRLERRDGVWRVAHRRAAYDWRRVDRVPSGGEYWKPAGDLVGRRNREDPVYHT